MTTRLIIFYEFTSISSTAWRLQFISGSDGGKLQKVLKSWDGGPVLHPISLTGELQFHSFNAGVQKNANRVFSMGM